jgi:hypothetical protein
MKYCSDCGKRFRAPSKFCVNCGTLLVKEANSNPSSKPRTAGAKAGKRKTKAEAEAAEKSRRANLFFGIIFLVIAVLVGVAVVGSFQGGVGNSSSQVATNTADPDPFEEDSTADPEPNSLRPGQRLMLQDLETLNREDKSGNWSEDQFLSTSPLNAGNLLDNYSVHPEGCAIWYFDNEEDSEIAFETGRVNMFSDFYTWWIEDSGPAFIIVANSENDLCYRNITRILQLSD